MTELLTRSEIEDIVTRKGFQPFETDEGVSYGYTGDDDIALLAAHIRVMKTALDETIASVGKLRRRYVRAINDPFFLPQVHATLRQAVDMLDEEITRSGRIVMVDR